MRALLSLLLCCALLGGSLAKANADEQRAVLTIRVNTVAKQEATVTLRDGDVLVARTDLEQAGLLGFPFNGAGKPDDLIPLSSLKPALTFHVDDVSLSLDLTVTPEHLGGTVVNFGPHQDIALSKPVPSTFSASANRQYNSNITNWIFDSAQSNKRLTIGDVVTSTGDLGGTVAIAG